MHCKIKFGAIAAAFLAVAAARAAEIEAATPAAGGKVNINQATAAQIVLLPRVGEKAAERIVEYRKEHGSFSRPEELMEVKGIGEKLFLVLKPYVTVSGPTTATEKIRPGSSRARSRGAATKKAASSTAPVGKGR